jgi:hypothetical protein
MYNLDMVIQNQKPNKQTSLVTKIWLAIVLISIIVAVLSGIVSFLSSMGGFDVPGPGAPSAVKAIWHVLKSPINSIFFVSSVAAFLSTLGLLIQFKKFDKYVLYNLIVLSISLLLYLFI